MTFGTLVWVVALASVALAALFFWVGRLWHHEYSDPPITKSGRIRKTSFGILMGCALFVLLGAFTVMRPTPKIDWIKDEATAIKAAKEQNKLIFIDFWAEWCARCNEIEGQSFSRPEFLKATENYVTMKADCTKDDTLMDQYDIGELPTFILMTPDKSRVKVLDANYLGKGDATELLVKEFDAFAAGVDTGETKGAFAEALAKGLLWALLAAFLGGLATSLTPCVYPMIPVTVSVIGGSAGGSQARAFINSVIYVGGIAICYSILGVTVAAVGGKFSALFQNPIFLIAVASMFLLLAAHMLEVRKLGFLMKIQGSAGQASGSGTGVWSLFLMGVLAGFVFAPCVGPVLLGVLTYIGESGDMFLGFIFMFTFALGMGLPFVILGTFSGLLGKMKRAGDWMIGVEAGFGAALVAAAMYFLIPVIPGLNTIFVALAKLAS